MGMDLLSMLIVNGVFVLAPLLCYLIYQVYVLNLSIKRKEMFLDFALITSTYLVIRYGFSYSLEGPKIMFGVPLILALVFDRKICMLILSIIGIYYYHSFGVNYVIIEYILYIIIYIFSKKYKNFKIIGIKLYVFLNSLFSFIIILSSLNIKKLAPPLVLTFLVYYFVLNILMTIFNKFDKIVNMNKSMKDLQNIKDVRESLFKITHEIKNPIAVCKGYLDMFDVNDKEHSKKYVPVIKEEIDRTLLLLQDFLSLNGVQVNKEEIDINYLIEEVCANFKPLLNEKKINLNLNIDDEIYIQGDYNRLVQVFINIIKNSIEAIQENGQIEIIETLEKNNIIIKIKDNGIGINKEDIENISKPFFTTKKNGTGLGVTLSKEIVESHNGTIIYNSVYGEGTEVLIKLKTQ